MPRICELFGIVITMNWHDHPPPHVHARYANHRASIVIADGSVMKGRLPPCQLRLVRRWATAHREELQVAWNQAQVRHLPKPIPPTLEG